MILNSLTTWVDMLQGRGRYDFTRQEAIADTDLSPEAVKKSLQRLVRRRRLAKVRDNFYVIIPIEYVAAGAPPTTWFIADLMRSFGRPYYVGLLSAAALHGAAHQQPQEFQVVTSAAQRPLRVARQRIRFFTKQQLDTTPQVDVKTPTGLIRVSSPEATALDLVRFSHASGYLGNVAIVLGDLAERLNPQALLDAAQRQPHLPTVQRLGYLLDRVGADAVAHPLAEMIAQRRPRVVPLRPDRPAEDAPRDARWRVLVNEEVEAET
jgi:predicted transcriptional regulator of viral defense system